VPARLGLQLAKWTTLGLYSHRETPDDASLSTALDRQRRAQRQVRFLETVAKSNSAPEVAWNLAEVRRAMNDLIAMGAPASSAPVVARIMQQTSDAEIRELCQRALAGIGSAGQ
jgi:DNA-directed RNA polymerase specialized sigma24 family protein